MMGRVACTGGYQNPRGDGDMGPRVKCTREEWLCYRSNTRRMHSGRSIKRPFEKGNDLNVDVKESCGEDTQDGLHFRGVWPAVATFDRTWRSMREWRDLEGFLFRWNSRTGLWIGDSIWDWLV
jgi:hypothetical protein